MNPATFRLVLLVSCAHALVHVFELALPSVEQMIGLEYSVGTEQTGWLGTVWRVPFGVGAVLTGWLVDRFGSKRLLMIYLAGCAATAVAAGWSRTFNGVFWSMLLMGCFASIYHPAGLALISHQTTPQTRGAALGWHGVFGSLGIAAAPFLAGVVFSSGDVTWRQYYLLLTLPAVVLLVVIALWLRESRPVAIVPATQPLPDSPARVPALLAAEQVSWKRYAVLVATGALSGFIYAGFMHFLPRYLDSSGLSFAGVSDASLRNRLAALVLLCGVVGQSVSGRLARPERLEWLLAVVYFANVPLLVWMAYATGPTRIVATCCLALVHFMNQPVYNSLIAQYVPVRRRSISYGFSNMLGFSIGGLGPAFAGHTHSDWRTYGGLAIVALLAGLVSLVLVAHRRG